MNKITRIIETGTAVDVAVNKIKQNSEIKKQENQIFQESNKNLIYEANQKIKKKINKIYLKEYKPRLRKEHKWSFTFYITSILLPLAVIIATIACVVLIENSFDKIVISSLIFVFGLTIDILPYAAYKLAILNYATSPDYSMDSLLRFCDRQNEKIVLNNSGFDYFYFNDFAYSAGLKEVAMQKYSIIFSDIDYVEYDYRVKELKIFNGIKAYEYKGENEYEEVGKWSFISIQNIYQIDIIEIMKENNVLVKEKDYRIQREEAAKVVLECEKNDKK